MLKEFLEDSMMVGQLSPWKKEDESEPVIALLTPVTSTLEEYNLRAEKKLTKLEFLKQLKSEGISVFNNVDEFVKLRDINESIPRKTKQKFTRKLSPERLEQLRKQTTFMNESKKGSTA